MKFYYLSRESNHDGDFEIHHRECSEIPAFHKRTYLGPFASHQEAFDQALATNPRSVICKTCRKGDLGKNISHFSDSESSHPIT